MNGYDRLERDAQTANPPRNLSHVWEKLAPLERAPAGVLARVDEVCTAKHITRAALDAQGVRWRSRGKGPELLLAWGYHGRVNGSRVVTAIKYRNLVTGERTAEQGSVYLEPLIVGDRRSLDWFVSEGETDGARLYDLVGDAASIVVAPAGALTFKPEWASLLPRGATVYLAHDADREGDKGAKKAAEVIGGRTVRVRPPNVKDWCEWDGDRSTFVSLVAVARERPTFEVETIAAFAAVEEPGAEALLGTSDAILIPGNGDVMSYGDGGVGKTTMQLDGACHLAAGDDWLGITVARPLRVLIIEDEGPRALFRQKLRRKLEGWQGSPIDDRILVVASPWACFTFADPAHRTWLADLVREHEIDIVMVGPLTAAGMEDAGTLQDVRAFLRLVQEVRERAGRLLTVWLVHHEGKGGKVSGAWEGAGDTLLHLTSEGHGRTRLYVQKARWSSLHHQTAMHLVWSENEGYTVEDKPELDDDHLAEQILAVITGKPGCTWTYVVQNTKGIGKDRRNAVRDGLFAAQRILNVVKVEAVETGRFECPERRPARLYPIDDPTIRHLRPDSAADEPQTAAGPGAGDQLRLRRAARLIEPHDVAADAAPAENGEEEIF